MYDPRMVQPMREELVTLGFSQMQTPDEVDALFGQAARTDTTLLVVNSVCGCSAGSARPGVALSLQQNEQRRPRHLLTVFAGQDAEATARVRSYFPDVPPSSPVIFLIKDGSLVFALHRHDIEGRDQNAVARELATAYERYCAPAPDTEHSAAAS